MIFLKSLFSGIWGYLLVGGLAIGFITGVYLYGKSAAEAEARARALEGSVKALRERNMTNEEIRNLPSRELCLRLGRGLPDFNESECL